MIDLSNLGLPKDLMHKMNVYTPEGADDRVLLYDGDGSCYSNSAGVAKLTTAQSRFEKDILTIMFLAKCSTARVHLTPKGCLKNNRHLLLGVNPYQYKRGSDKKPALLEMLRDSAPTYFADHPTIQVFNQYKLEADDSLMIDVYSMNNGVLVSPDKDLLISPKEQYMTDSGKFIKLPDGERYGWIEKKEWCTPSGKVNSKVIGKGTKFYLAQLLMGDSADDVKGIIKYKGKLCGQAGAYAALEHIDCEDEAVNLVLDGYRVLDQNIIPEGAAMWLLRSHDDDVYKYLVSNELTAENRAYLDDCYYNRKWTLTAEEYADMTEAQYYDLFKK